MIAQMEPVAERECRRRTRGKNCDFLIVVDPDGRKPANATQGEDDDGRPVIIFTKALIRRAKNGDEIAFVLGHEVAHHIHGHLEQTMMHAANGAVALRGLIAAKGGSEKSIEKATHKGAVMGVVTYSKGYELEADALGTIITHKAGFDPVRGAVFFQRIPDPGDKFLSTHPPHADRVGTVHKVARGL